MLAVSLEGRRRHPSISFFVPRWNVAGPLRPPFPLRFKIVTNSSDFRLDISKDAMP